MKFLNVDEEIEKLNVVGIFILMILSDFMGWIMDQGDVDKFKDVIGNEEF